MPGITMSVTSAAISPPWRSASASASAASRRPSTVYPAPRRTSSISARTASSSSHSSSVSVAAEARPRAVLDGLVGALVRRRRQQDGERRAQPGVGDDLDAPAGLRDDPVHGREPQPRAEADVLGRVERLEDPLQHVGLDSRAGVADGQPHVLAGGAGLDRERAAVGHRVAGVDRQVDHDLLELRAVGQHRRQIRRRPASRSRCPRRSAARASARARRRPR